jgi:hypothetical protein
MQLHRQHKSQLDEQSRAIGRYVTYRLVQLDFGVSVDWKLNVEATQVNRVININKCKALYLSY